MDEKRNASPERNNRGRQEKLREQIREKVKNGEKISLCPNYDVRLLQSQFYALVDRQKQEQR